jgi:hypothetical protein
MAFKLGLKTLANMSALEGKNLFVQRNRDWGSENKGAGHVQSQEDGFWSGDRGGVSMPTPINFRMNLTGVGKTDGETQVQDKKNL